MHEWPNYFFLDWYYLFYISHKRFQNYRLTPVYKAILSLVIRIHPEKIQLMLGYFLQLFHHTDPSGIQIIKILQQKRCHEKVDLLLGYYTLLIILIYYLKYGWFFCLSYSLYQQLQALLILPQLPTLTLSISTNVCTSNFTELKLQLPQLSTKIFCRLILPFLHYCL